MAVVGWLLLRAVINTYKREMKSFTLNKIVAIIAVVGVVIYNIFYVMGDMRALYLMIFDLPIISVNGLVNALVAAYVARLYLMLRTARTRALPFIFTSLVVLIVIRLVTKRSELYEVIQVIDIVRYIFLGVSVVLFVGDMSYYSKEAKAQRLSVERARHALERAREEQNPDSSDDIVDPDVAELETLDRADLKD